MPLDAVHKAPRISRPVFYATVLGALFLIAFVVIPLYLVRINMTPVRYGGSSPSPADFRLPFETIDLIAMDGVLIRAWLIHGDTGAPCIVMVHGKGASKSGLLHLARVLHAAGYHVLLPDLRGHGESGEALMTFGLHEAYDVEVAVAALERRSGVDFNRIGVYAQSMGTAAAVRALGTRPAVRGFVLDSSYDALDRLLVDIGVGVYGLPRLVAAQSDLAYRFFTGQSSSEVNSAAILSLSDRPCLFFHSSVDGTIPIERGRTLFEAAAGPKEFVVTEGAHTGSWGDSPAAYEQRLLGFFARAFADSPARPLHDTMAPL